MEIKRGPINKAGIAFEMDIDTGAHRLVNTKTGRKTILADYTQATYLDGYVGITAYYSCGMEQILAPDEFARMVAVSELNPG